MIGVTSLLLPLAVHATEPKPPPPDEDFLEYLGSTDDEDPAFAQYLARSHQAKGAGVKAPVAKVPPKPGDGST